MRLLGAIWDGVISLLVDDGFLAVAALVTIGAVGLLTRAGALGPGNLAGWMIFGALGASVVISCRRAIR